MGGGVDYLTALQTYFLESLPGLVAAGAWVYWERASQGREDREARASERQPMLFRLPRTGDAARRPAPRDAGVVAVLLSTPDLAERVRRALRKRFRLYFAPSWRELQRAVTRLAPCALVVDPTADPTGDAEGHLVRLTAAANRPIMLYLTLTPESAGGLVGLGGLGIRDVAFYRYADEAERFVSVCDRGETTGPPPLRAA